MQIEENTFLLKDLFTEKTFQPKGEPKLGATLWQQSLGGNKHQYWEFLEQVDGNFRVRLKGTDLYLAASSVKTDSPVVLMLMQDDEKQKWKLVPQTPWI